MVSLNIKLNCVAWVAQSVERKASNEMDLSPAQTLYFFILLVPSQMEFWALIFVVNYPLGAPDGHDK